MSKSLGYCSILYSLSCSSVIVKSFDIAYNEQHLITVFAQVPGMFSVSKGSRLKITFTIVLLFSTQLLEASKRCADGCSFGQVLIIPSVRVGSSSLL